MKITFILGLVLMINGLGVETNEVAIEGNEKHEKSKIVLQTIQIIILHPHITVTIRYFNHNLGKVEDIEEMTELLARAEMEIEEELRKEMENGATSKRYPRKKVTVV